jgi:polysaccharide biosynthesis protein
LGVINLQSFKKLTEIENFIKELTKLFDNPDTQKNDITQLMKRFLVNFDHQETGKYLDSKM